MGKCSDNCDVQIINVRIIEVGLYTVPGNVITLLFVVEDLTVSTKTLCCAINEPSVMVLPFAVILKHVHVLYLYSCGHTSCCSCM